MKIKQRKKGTSRTVEVSGSLTAGNSLQLHKAITGNLGKGHHLELVFGDVTDVDLSFVQLTAAAARAAEKGDRTFSLRNPVPEPVFNSLKVSGLIDHDNCGDPACVWCTIDAQVQED